MSVWQAKCGRHALAIFSVMLLCAGCGGSAASHGALASSDGGSAAVQSSPSLASGAVSSLPALTQDQTTVQASSSFSALASGFNLVGSMTIARSRPIAVALLDGRVLVAGGSANKAVDLYDPQTGRFSRTGSMAAGRGDGGSGVRLDSGSVLVAGGEDNSTAQTPLPTAETYDVGSGQFQQAGSMLQARDWSTMTRLPDGRVLVCGGFDTKGNYLASAELYDPKSRRFTQTGHMLHARANHAAVLLANGKVLVVGGVDAGTSMELYDPKTGRFTDAGNLLTPRLLDFTATRLRDGRVLIVGGSSSSAEEIAISSAELYDPAIRKSVRVHDMLTPRDGQTSTLLSDGRVLVAGGGSASAEVFNPTTMTFTATAAMRVARTDHSATLLGNGSVLLAGGAWDPNGATAEVYVP